MPYKTIITIILGLAIITAAFIIYKDSNSTKSEPKITNQPNQKDNNIIMNNSQNASPESLVPISKSSDPIYKTVNLDSYTYVDETTKIYFRDVIYDDRCPKNTRCDTNGYAEVKLQLIDDASDFSKAYISNIKIQGLNTDKDGNLFENFITEQNEMPYKNLLITAVNVEPYPERSVPINKKDYKVLLRITPAK